MQLLMAYEFPGNVRELENIMERGVIFCRGHSLSVADLQLESAPADAAPLLEGQTAEMPFREAKERAIQYFHSQYIRRLLEQYGGNISRAAEAAGIQRQYLHRLIKEAGIEATDFKSKE
jgi:DNA-binding NtrC family response regulator